MHSDQKGNVSCNESLQITQLTTTIKINSIFYNVIQYTHF